MGTTKTARSRQAISAVAVALPAFIFFYLGLLLPSWQVFTDAFAVLQPTAQTNAEFSSAYFFSALKVVEVTTLRIATAVAATTTLLALFLGILIRGLPARPQTLVLLLSAFPLGVHIAFRVFGLQYFLSAEGPIGRLANFAPSLLSLLFSEKGTILGLIHWTFPLALVILFIAISRLPADQIAAAALLGAPRRAVLFRIELPHLLPTLLVTFALVFCLAYGSFITPTALGGLEDITVSRMIGMLLREGHAEPAAVFAAVGLLTPLLVFSLIAGCASRAQSRLRRT